MNKVTTIFLATIFCLLGPKQLACAQGSGKDSIYKFGNFLIHPTDTMKIDFIVKGKPHKPIQGKHDTLYDDSKYLILGDANKLGYYDNYGIFKKYKLPYQFSNYKVNVFKGKLALPNFKTDPKALMFRTQIKNQCKSEGVNFAGHFTLVHWGCGSECKEIAIVDRITGRISYSDIIPLSIAPFYAFKFKPDSKMIIFNDWLFEGYNGYLRWSDKWGLAVAKWDNSKFAFLLNDDPENR